jgi:hypothetical protein
METKLLREKLREARIKLKKISEDAHFADQLIDEIIDLQKQIDVEPTELDIPVSDVQDEVFTNEIALKKTRHGFLFCVGTSYFTYIDFNQQNAYQMAEMLFNLLKSETKNEQEKLIQDAALYVLQTPIVAAIGEDAFFSIATAVVHAISKRGDDLIELAKQQNAAFPTREEMQAEYDETKAREAIEEVISGIAGETSVNQS